MAFIEMDFASGGTSEKIEPQTITVPNDGTSYATISLTKTPKYFMFILYHSSSAMNVVEYYHDEDKFYHSVGSSFRGDGEVYRTSGVVTIESNQIKLKGANSSWGTTWYYTIAY